MPDHAGVVIVVGRVGEGEVLGLEVVDYQQLTTEKNFDKLLLCLCRQREEEERYEYLSNHIIDYAQLD